MRRAWKQPGRCCQVSRGCLFDARGRTVGGCLVSGQARLSRMPVVGRDVARVTTETFSVLCARVPATSARRLRRCGYTQTVHVVVQESRSRAIHGASRCLRKTEPEHAKRDASTDTSPATTLRRCKRFRKLFGRDATSVRIAVATKRINTLTSYESTPGARTRIRQVPLNPTFLGRVTQSQRPVWTV